MKTIMLYPNIQKKSVVIELEHICEILEKEARVILPDWAEPYFVHPSEFIFFSEIICTSQADFIVTLGGDGTILRAAGLSAAYQIPIVGVNFGHLGFMTDLERKEISLLSKIIHGNYTVEDRMMLDIDVYREKQIVYSAKALNEAIVTNGIYFNKTIQIDLKADRIPIINFRGDGIIIATPTGSTAYSLSAGGPVIEPSAENMVVTPLCAHAVRASSYVFSSKRTIRVEAITYEKKSAFLAVDGNEAVEILPTDIVQIKRSPLMMKLIRVKGRSIYRILSEKLSNGGVI